MSELSADHPENAPVATAMREVKCIRAVEWCHDTTYKVWFTSHTTEAQIEHFLDKLEAECRFTPTDEQVRGRNVLVDRETVPIEINDETAAVSDDE